MRATSPSRRAAPSDVSASAAATSVARLASSASASASSSAARVSRGVRENVSNASAAAATASGQDGRIGAVAGRIVRGLVRHVRGRPGQRGEKEAGRSISCTGPRSAGSSADRSVSRCPAPSPATMRAARSAPSPAPRVRAERQARPAVAQERSVDHGLVRPVRVAARALERARSVRRLEQPVLLAPDQGHAARQEAVRPFGVAHEPSPPRGAVGEALVGPQVLDAVQRPDLGQPVADEGEVARDERQPVGAEQREVALRVERGVVVGPQFEDHSRSRARFGRVRHRRGDARTGGRSLRGRFHHYRRTGAPPGIGDPDTGDRLADPWPAARMLGWRPLPRRPTAMLPRYLAPCR